MGQQSYSLEEEGPKRLTLKWGFGWKELKVYLDGRKVGQIDGGLKVLKKGGVVALPDGRELRVRVDQKFLGPHVHLHVDDAPVPGSEFKPIPKWSYAFVGACVLIPIVSLGGAIPAALGIGGAAGVAALARDESKPLGTRLALSAAVCVGCWTLFVMLILLATGS